MLLNRCGCVFGEIGTAPARLRLTTYERALMLGWSLYDDRRIIIPDAAFLRAADGMKVMTGELLTETVPARVPATLPAGPDYFWIGPMHLHFGHFLVSTISRLWALLDEDPARYTFLYNGAGTPAELFTLGFVRDVLGALGVRPERMLHVAGPLLIPNVTVAEPSTVENLWVSGRYIDTLRRVREAVAPGVEDNVRRDPIYVSKQRVPSGVRTVANEDAVTALLEQRGIEVAYPDTLDFRQQIAFWCQHRAAIGLSASAFHMAGFSTGKRLCTLFPYAPASMNQFAIDQAAGNAHLHLNAGAAMVGLGPSPTFADVLSVADPQALADEVWMVAAHMEAWTGQSVGAEPRSAWTAPAHNEPFGTNMARHGHATQSSLYPLDEGSTRTAEGALSGRLTGFFQCSTDNQPQPWWQVDLGVRAYLYELRVFNRCDNPVAVSRLEHFLVYLSDDGADWRIGYEHHGAAPGGLTTGGPWRWQPGVTTVTRFVRIGLPGHDYLHFDQVEVFGEPVRPGPLATGLQLIG